jgi:hypothetical protein
LVEVHLEDWERPEFIVVKFQGLKGRELREIECVKRRKFGVGDTSSSVMVCDICGGELGANLRDVISLWEASRTDRLGLMDR